MRSLQKEKKKKKRGPQIIRRGFAMDLIGAWLPPQRSVYGVQSMYSEGYSLFAVFCLFLHFFFLFSLLSSTLSTLSLSLSLPLSSINSLTARILQLSGGVSEKRKKGQKYGGSL